MLNKEQKDKLERLKKLSDVDETVITNPREALRLAYQLDVIKHWTDIGSFYTIGLKSGKQVRKRPFEVAEFVVDKILSVKDPLKELSAHDEAIEEEANESSVEEEMEDNPEQEPEKDSPEEEAKKPLDYDDLTVAELKDLCRERELSGYSTLKKEEIISLLELDDQGLLKE